ncbi:flagellin lysine-N-methylase [Priestia sp. BR_2]
MEKIVLTPRYMNSFVCIGSECEDNCCSAGWQISIDKKTYLKYKNIKHSELRKEIKDSVKRNKNEVTSDSKYAFLKMNENKHCSLLNENKMCAVHLKLGEDMLSPVCATFPRIQNQIDNQFELSATLSCPEAARLALLNPDGIDFEKKDYEPNKNWSTKINLKTQNINNGNMKFHEVREFAIDIVQSRLLSLSDRLIFLGLFMNKLQEILDRKSYHEINDLIQEYQIKLSTEQYLNSIQLIHDNISLQIETTIGLVKARKKSDISSVKYLECLEDLMNGLNIRDENHMDNQKVVDVYLFNYKNYYAPFIAGYEYILENYVVNYMFESMFPNMAVGDPFKDYIKLASLFAMLKLHFVGISGEYKGLSQDLAVKIIYTFVRAFEHNLSYKNGMMELIEENGFNTLAHIVSLLKDRKIEKIQI